MCIKLIKFTATLVIGFAAVGGLIFGSQIGSYVSTSTRCVQESVQQSVPMEFELRRARDLVDQVIPELRANIRTIAREEIEVERLEREVAQAEHDLLKRRESVAALKGNLEVVQVSYHVNGRDISRQQLAERLASQFEQYKRAKIDCSQQAATTRHATTVATVSSALARADSHQESRPRTNKSRGSSHNIGSSRHNRWQPDSPSMIANWRKLKSSCRIYRHD